ncbi:unnamed protein product [Amoebophrya sp. A25]|nr:unnamed protein product [Amoebophrya sp. A25]|eukprot:GSA25T00016689001.1
MGNQESACCGGSRAPEKGTGDGFTLAGGTSTTNNQSFVSMFFTSGGENTAGPQTSRDARPGGGGSRSLSRSSASARGEQNKLSRRTIGMISSLDSGDHIPLSPARSPAREKTSSSILATTYEEHKSALSQTGERESEKTQEHYSAMSEPPTREHHSAMSTIKPASDSNAPWQISERAASAKNSTQQGGVGGDNNNSSSYVVDSASSTDEREASVILEENLSFPAAMLRSGFTILTEAILPGTRKIFRRQFQEYPPPDGTVYSVLNAQQVKQVKQYLLREYGHQFSRRGIALMVDVVGVSEDDVEGSNDCCEHSARLICLVLGVLETNRAGGLEDQKENQEELMMAMFPFVYGEDALIETYDDETLKNLELDF